MASGAIAVDVAAPSESSSGGSVIAPEFGGAFVINSRPRGAPLLAGFGLGGGNSLVLGLLLGAGLVAGAKLIGRV